MKKVKNIFGQKIKYFFKDIIETNRMGYYDYHEKTITIHNQLKGHDLISTILHEEFHAAWDQLGINQTSIHPDVQEIICEGLSKFTTEHYFLKEK